MTRKMMTKGKDKIDAVEDKLWDEKEMKETKSVKQLKTIPELRKGKA